MKILKSLLKQKQNNKIMKFGARFLVFLALFLMPNMAIASTSEIDQLDAQINSLNQQLAQKQSERKTLQGQVAIIDSQIYLIQLQINSTQLKIDQTNKDITETGNQIIQAEIDLKAYREQLGEILRTSYEEGQISTIELVARSNNFSDFVNQTEYLETVQLKITELTSKIVKLKGELEQKKVELEKQKTELEKLKEDQIAQKASVDTQRAEKNNLLLVTKGQESEYQNQLKNTQAELNRAWANYWAEQNNASGSGGSSYYGGSGNGYLQWPSNGGQTQGYGCTSFAQCGNPNGPYSGSPHNGLDISMGWAGAIYAAAEGTVLRVAYHYAWGNHILIRHPNGLVTLYAHLSSINVTTGQTVSKGQVIGREGSTGISTGSHLHFSVYTQIALYAPPYSFSYGTTVNPYTFL